MIDSRAATVAPLELAREIGAILAGSWRTDAGQAEPGPNSDRVAPLLELGGAAALAWRRLRESGLDPESETMSILHRQHRISRLDSARREREAARAIAFLRGRGFEPLVFKGLAAARLYPERGLRPWSDVDLVVDPADYDAAREALWEFFPTIAVDLHRRRERRARHGGFHRHPGDFFELADRDWDDVRAHSVEISLVEGTVRIPGPEDHLRILCLHFLKHGGYRPLWLCDIAAAVEGRRPDFDWRRFCSGDPWRVRWSLAAIRLAGDHLGAEVSDTPAAESRLPGWIAKSILRRWEEPGRWPNRRPVIGALSPARLWGDLASHMPGALESSINWRGPANAFPRFPYRVLEAGAKMGAIRDAIRSARARAARRTAAE